MSEFFKGVIPRDTLKTLLLEAGEYVANAISVKFEARCDKGLLRDASATILCSPFGVKEIVVGVTLSTQVDARDFLTRIYQSLTSKSCYVEVSSDGIYVARRVRCHVGGGVEFLGLVWSILSEFGESCELKFSGAYELLWYAER